MPARTACGGSTTCRRLGLAGRDAASPVTVTAGLPFLAPTNAADGIQGQGTPQDGKTKKDRPRNQGNEAARLALWSLVLWKQMHCAITMRASAGSGDWAVQMHDGESHFRNALETGTS